MADEMVDNARGEVAVPKVDFKTALGLTLMPWV